MERKKTSVSLKTAAKNRTTAKEAHLDNGTNQASSLETRILRDTELNRSNRSALSSRRGSYLETREKSHDQNEGIDFHCSFENDSSPGQEIDIRIPCTQPLSHNKILEGVVAYIEVHSNAENRFEGISKQVELLGAKVTKKFTPEVTHVIFKDGKRATIERAVKKGIHLVSVLWVESSRQSGKRVSEDLFPVHVVEPGEATSPVMVGRLRRTKSMQPKAFEDDVQRSADRGEKRKKRKLRAANMAPPAVIYCAETQDVHSPIVPNPMATPRMVPDTPCRVFDVSPNSTEHDIGINSPQDKPIEPIKFSESETDQSDESSDDTPSSIRKLKKRLLSKSTPTRRPSLTLTASKITPVAQVRKTPNDVQLTGSEQGKKRKRQDLTRESHDKDIKQTIAKQVSEEDDNETCTEEEEQRPEEKENRIVKKQRTKIAKKVKPKRSIVMTSMHFNEQDIVLSVVRKLSGFFIEDRVSPSTSHVIAGSPRRTLNVLMAIAQGCWLVSPVWTMKSLEVGYWVDEEPYELSDAFPAAQLCRLERVSAGAGYRQELFVDCPPIYVSENCSPPSDSLMALVSLCGGKVSSSVRKAGICIGSMTRRTQGVNITEQWLLDCITQHVVLPFTKYGLNSPAKRRRETSPSY